MDIETIDFTESRWGHSMHGQTMREVKATSYLDSFQDWLDSAYRASVMVHSSQRLKVGVKVKWTAASGTITAPVYQIKSYDDPKDMFTLFVRITPDCRTPTKQETDG